MFYYKFVSDTPYCGTEEEHFEAFEEQPTEEELTEYADSFRADAINNFSYLINDWDGDEPTDEQMEEFESECSCTYTEISKEEYEENV